MPQPVAARATTGCATVTAGPAWNAGSGFSQLRGGMRPKPLKSEATSNRCIATSNRCIATSNRCIASSSRCIASSNRCIASSNKKLLVDGQEPLVASLLLVLVAMIPSSKLTLHRVWDANLLINTLC